VCEKFEHDHEDFYTVFGQKVFAIMLASDFAEPQAPYLTAVTYRSRGRAPRSSTR
jgi:hypothetical protein